MTTLCGRRVTLDTFEEGQINERYLGWLSDPVVNTYSRRADQRSVLASEARAYLASLGPEEEVLAIHTSQHGHVGNVKFGPIDRTASRADISILIGERSVWGQGIGRESVYLVSKYLIWTVGLNRVDAGTTNPAFVRMVQSLGWQVEGVLREKISIGSRIYDQTLVALLADGFQELSEYAPTSSDYHGTVL